MKLTILRPTEIEVIAIRLVLPVRYEEDDMRNDYPHRKGDVWDVTVDIDTGQIRDWPKGEPAHHLQMKVTDSGSYYLLYSDGLVAAEMDDYVPGCIPGNYGDYIDFQIDGQGVIANWKERCTPERVNDSFFKDRED